MILLPLLIIILLTLSPFLIIIYLLLNDEVVFTINETDRFSSNKVTLERSLDLGITKDQMILLGFIQDFETKSFYFPIRFEGFLKERR